MYRFDLNAEPPTTQELKSVLQGLTLQRRKLVKKSCIADGFHILILSVLYFGDFLSGAAISVTVALGLVIAIVLATATKEKLDFSDLAAIAASIIGTATAIAAILAGGMSQPWGASLIAGATAGSIVLSGTCLGRALKAILFSIEQITPIPVEDDAYQELGFLCREYPPLNHYRDQAAQNLRPHLTYGELAAMRDWYLRQHANLNQSRPKR